MNTENLRIELAKLEGWTLRKKPGYAAAVDAVNPEGIVISKREAFSGWWDAIPASAPNYTEDLNAVARLEKLLTEEEYWGIPTKNGFVDYLMDEVKGKTFSATAPQRCIAIARVKGIEV